WSLSQWDSATEQFQAELSVDPANCMARWKIGAIVLQRNGNPDEALADINRALSMCPSLTDARVDRARALIKLNRNAEAGTDLEAAAKASSTRKPRCRRSASWRRACGRPRPSEPKS